MLCSWLRGLASERLIGRLGLRATYWPQVGLVVGGLIVGVKGRASAYATSCRGLLRSPLAWRGLVEILTRPLPCPRFAIYRLAVQLPRIRDHQLEIRIIIDARAYVGVVFLEFFESNHMVHLRLVANIVM